MKKCGLKTTPITNKCDYCKGNNRCLKETFCVYQEDMSSLSSDSSAQATTSHDNAINPNYTPPASVTRKKCNAESSNFRTFCEYKINGECAYDKYCYYQAGCKPTLEERAKQECADCSHSKVCKFREKFESLKEDTQPPLLCVCQFYTMIETIKEIYNRGDES